MPIHGLTDKASTPGRAKSFYSLWKGDRKGDRSAGKSLGDRFRFECENQSVRQLFSTFYEDRPSEVRIYLPHDSTDEVFETWMWSFGSGGFGHKCDGQRIFQKSVKKKRMVGDREVVYRQREHCDEPCRKPEGDRECPSCNPAGLFHFYIRELYGHGVGSMSVTGDRDISGLTQQLRDLEDRFKGLNNSPIPSFTHYGFIPYILRKVRKRGTTPYSKKGEVSLFDDLIITPDPSWLEEVRLYAATLRFKEDPVSVQVLAPGLASEIKLLSGSTLNSNWSGPYFNKIESHQRRLRWTGDRLDLEASAIYSVPSHRHIKEEDLSDFVSHLSRIPSPSSTDRESLLAESDRLIEEIASMKGEEIADAKKSWREYVKQTYGKLARQQLNDEELLEFVRMLRSQESLLVAVDVDVEAIEADWME